MIEYLSNKMMKLLNILIVFWGALTVLHAQVPVPAGEQSQPFLLKGGTAHLGNGQVIENSVVGFDKGKLTIVGKDATGVNESDYEVIDVSGKHIYPGLILPNTQLGISEVSAVRAMNDAGEAGLFNPNVRSQIAYNTDSENIPAFRFNGILLAEPTPTGGVVSGTSSVMELDGWNWEDATHTADVAIHMNWPAKMSPRFDYNTFTVSWEQNKDYDKAVIEIEQFFDEAVSYGTISGPEKNLKLEAMQGLFKGDKTLVLHCNDARALVEGIKIIRSKGVENVAVFGGQDVLHIAGFLANNNVAVVLPSVHETPDREDLDYDLPYKIGAELSKAGVKVSLSHTGMLGNARNLPFYAGTLVAHGMEKEEALKTITLNTAQVLGIDKRVGSLEVGKDATLFVSEGDALDMRTNILIHTFISGKKTTLDGRQQWLYKKYSDKYGH